MKSRRLSRFLWLTVLACSFLLLQAAVVYAAPPVAMNDGPYSTPEDTPLVVAAPGVLANDSDPDTDPVTVDTPSYSQPPRGTVVMNADGSFTYTPDPGFAGTDTFTYFAIANGELSNEATVTVNVTGGVNDAPVITVPGTQTTRPSTPLTFSTANGNLISVDDVDVQSGLFNVTMSIADGTLALSGTSGLVGDLNGTDGTLNFSGDMVSVNAALNGMQFTPSGALGAGATRTLNITVNDLGNTGSGGFQSDSETVNIVISGALIVQSGGSTDVTEGAATDSYTIALASLPTADVTITITPDAQCTVSVPSLTFTSGNGTTPQPVTVTAVNDTTVEGDHTCTITHTATSTDINYNGVTVPNVVANITDNDGGVIVVESDGSTTATEGGPNDTYTIRLTSDPGVDVNVTMTPGAQCTVTPAPPIVLNSGNWNIPQTVTVIAVDDGIVEATTNCLITHSATSANGTFNGIVINSVNATILDDDAFAVTVTQSGGSTNITEGGITDSYTVVLESQPTGDVTITISPDAQCTTNVPTLTFTMGNWNVAQTVTVTAVNDMVIEGPHTCTITHSAASTDTNFNGISIASVVANITDNDFAPAVNIGGLPADTSESGTTGDYTIVLNSQPTDNVTINITPDTQCTTDVPSVIFTTVNWNVPQPVIVTAVDDMVIEANPHPCVITHSATSTDGNYNGISIANVTSNITENDFAPGVTVGGLPADSSESGTTGDYTLVLDTMPTGDVTITITPDAQCTTDVPSVTFTTGNWNVAQPVTVTAVDDMVVEGAHTCIITHTVAGGSAAEYIGVTIANVTSNITDNDFAPGVTVGGLPADTSESGTTGDYTLVLDTMPTGDVTITITPDAQCTTNVPSVTFTTGNWNVAQPVTVTAVDDMVVEASPHSCIIAHAVAGGSAAEYLGVSIASVTSNITDNDVGPGVTIGGLPADAAEGSGFGDYTMVLNTMPSANVTITVSPDAQCTVSGNLTFDSANWNTPQTVLVFAVDDAVAEANPHPCVITHTATSADSGYNGISIANVTSNITDNDGGNIAPVGVADAYTTTQDTPLTVPAPGVLANDTDSDGPSALTVNGNTNPTSGSVTVNANGSFTYTPNLGFNGTDSFTYTATDGADDSLSTTVTITVNPPGNVAPVANNDAYVATELIPLIVAAPGVLTNDTDANGNPLQAQLVTNVTNGTLTLNANGSFTYTSNAGATTDSFTYNAFDGTTTSAAPATVTITVTPAGSNTAPVVTVAGVTTGISGTTVVIHVPFTDNPGDTHTATVDWGDGTGPQAAVVAGMAVDGAFTYPTTGTFTITIVITDQLGASTTYTIILDVGTGVVSFPPPVALCMDQNFIATSTIRANVPDAIRHTVRCRPIVANGTYTNSPEETPMGSENIGVQSVLQMGVQQAVDVFSIEGLVNLDGVTICLKGSGTLLHLYGAPRTPHNIPTYPVAAFPGFTCGSVPQTGTLVLVNGSNAVGSGGGGTSQSSPQPTLSDPGLRLDSFPECTAVAFGGVNVRSTPSERGALLGVLSPDTPMDLITRVGMWYVIEYQGQAGYVRMDLVAFSCSS